MNIKANPAIMKLNNVKALKIYKLIMLSQNWEKSYSFFGSEGDYWVGGYEDTRFASEEEMKEFAFLDWCNCMADLL